jgi:hypothetical protein
LLRTYRPEAIAAALAIGLGTAGVASGAALARTPDGRQVSALGEAVNGTLRWGRREQRRYLRMPARVLVLVTRQDVTVYEWTTSKGRGRQVARWPHGSVTVDRVRYLGEIGVHVETPDGKIAVLTGRRGLTHPRARDTVDAILDHAHRTPTTAQTNCDDPASSV